MKLFELLGTIAISGTDQAKKDINSTSSEASNLGTKLKSGIKTVGKWGVAVSAAAATAGAAAVTGITKLATSAAGTADEIDKMSQKIGISKQGYQEWSYVLGQNGMDISSLQMGMKTLVSQMDGVTAGTESSTEAFNALGLSVYDANGNLKDQETMMNEVMIALADMPNGTEKARLATELFGRSGSELMPMLNQGSEAMKDLTKRSHELGLIMSDDTVNAGVVLGDTIDDVKQSIGMLVTNLGAKMMPIIQRVCDYIIDSLPMIQSLFNMITPLLENAFSTFMPVLEELAADLLPVIFDIFQQIAPIGTQLVGAILPVLANILTQLLPPLLEIVQIVMPLIISLLVPILSILQPVLDLLVPILDVLVALLKPLAELLAYILPPLIQIIVDVIDVCVALLTNWELLGTKAKALWTKVTGIYKGAAEWIYSVVIKPIKKYFADMWQDAIAKAQNAWTGIKNAFSNVATWFKDIFSKAWQGVKNVFSTGGKIFTGIKEGIANVFKTVVNGIIGGINKVISTPFSQINTMLNKIRSVKIPVINQKPFSSLWGENPLPVPQIPQLATGTVVDQATKAVIGEDGAEAVMPLEKHTGWMDYLATELVERQGNNNSNAVVDKLDELIKAILSLKIYLDSGTLVGELTPAIDSGLGQIYINRGRGR